MLSYALELLLCKGHARLVRPAESKDQLIDAHFGQRAKPENIFDPGDGESGVKVSTNRIAGHLPGARTLSAFP